jgi:hypothetical protein
VHEIKVCGRVTAQAASGRLLTMEVPVRYYGNPRAIRNVVALKRASSPSASVFPANAPSTNFPYSFIIRGMGPGRNSNSLTPTTRIWNKQRRYWMLASTPRKVDSSIFAVQTVPCTGLFYVTTIVYHYRPLHRRMCGRSAERATSVR